MKKTLIIFGILLLMHCSTPVDPDLDHSHDETRKALIEAIRSN